VREVGGVRRGLPVFLGAVADVGTGLRCGRRQWVWVSAGRAVPCVEEEGGEENCPSRDGSGRWVRCERVRSEMPDARRERGQGGCDGGGGSGRGCGRGGGGGGGVVILSLMW
jgi:hypothetical protein